MRQKKIWYKELFKGGEKSGRILWVGGSKEGRGKNGVNEV